MEVKIEQSWKRVLKREFASEKFKKLAEFVVSEYQTRKVYPPAKQIFRAFDVCPFDKVQVVILGQDPYHGPGQANGLCFAVNEGVKPPPSLMNVYKEIEQDVGVKMSNSGSLEKWASQGVLMLNATLTVLASQAGSHQKKGWEEFTDAVIRHISGEKEGVVFLLWGRYAQDKGAVIDRKKHLVLEAAHPSPFSAYSGFFGCGHFSKTNDYLIATGREPIDWGS